MTRQIVELKCFIHKGAFTVDVDIKEGQKIGEFAICGKCLKQIHEELDQEKGVKKWIK